MLPQGRTATASDFAAVVGMVLGTAGFVMSLMNYIRDKAKIRVSVQWNMVETMTRERMALVKVTNVGRRPIFISIVSIELPKGAPYDHLILNDSIRGIKLSEGDQPAAFPVSSEGFEKYKPHWKKMRAYVEDSTGKRYRSPRPQRGTAPPHWATSTGKGSES